MKSWVSGQMFIEWLKTEMPHELNHVARLKISTPRYWLCWISEIISPANRNVY